MILIINNDPVIAHAISEILSFAGIPSSTSDRYRPSEAQKYRAVIFTSADADIHAGDGCKVPLFLACADGVTARSACATFSAVFGEGELSSSLLQRISAYQREYMLPVSGVYRLAGIDASVELKNECRYFDTRIRLTRTEAMILRYLIAVFPRTVGSRDIAEHVFRRERMPEESNVRTHICSLNKKFTEVLGKRLVICGEGGYMINTPVTSPYSYSAL